MKETIRGLTPSFVLSWYHFLWAFFGALVYGFPTRELMVIGVTGTDGKSTTVEMITRVLRESGAQVASTSSVWFQIGEKKDKNKLKMSMPGRFFLQQFLRQAVKAGCTHAVIEVSSEGIVQHRHRFLNFHTAVITNLSPEHIERHHGFENYKKAKGKLFAEAKAVHVLNADDEHVSYFSQFPVQKKVLYGIQKSGNGTVRAEDVQESREGASFVVQGTRFQLQLLGQFNVYNALAAISVGIVQGISLEVCQKALSKMERMPGRFEVVAREPFSVVVDYAVTPKAYEGLYGAVKSLYQPRQMICVFGSCGGGRDAWRRPVLGRLAEKYCNKTILTNEDPYDEDPEKIIDQIASGFLQTQNVSKVIDRREAIATALSQAREGDVVVITGKGSEDAIAVAGGKKIPWSDAETVREEIKKL